MALVITVSKVLRIRGREQAGGLVYSRGYRWLNARLSRRRLSRRAPFTLLRTSRVETRAFRGPSLIYRLATDQSLWKIYTREISALADGTDARSRATQRDIRAPPKWRFIARYVVTGSPVTITART